MVGLTYHALGEYGRAKDYHERAPAIRKKVSGDQHPDVAGLRRGEPQKLKFFFFLEQC